MIPKNINIAIKQQHRLFDKVLCIADLNQPAGFNAIAIYNPEAQVWLMTEHRFPNLEGITIADIPREFFGGHLVANGKEWNAMFDITCYGLYEKTYGQAPVSSSFVAFREQMQDSIESRQAIYSSINANFSIAHLPSGHLSYRELTPDEQKISELCNEYDSEWCQYHKGIILAQIDATIFALSDNFTPDAYEASRQLIYDIKNLMPTYRAFEERRNTHDDSQLSPQSKAELDRWAPLTKDDTDMFARILYKIDNHTTSEGLMNLLQPLELILQKLEEVGHDNDEPPFGDE